MCGGAGRHGEDPVYIKNFPPQEAKKEPSAVTNPTNQFLK
jgi:hypothetical protein